MKIISNWRQAPRMMTVWVGSIATIFGLLPADQQMAILVKLGVAPLQVPAYIGFTFLLARLIQQPATHTE